MVLRWLVVGALALTCATAQAAVPHLVRYQGTAVDAKGVLLEGPYTLKFRLYDAATGGAVVWDETHTDVPITKGHFSVLLGQVTPLNVDWNTPLWLAVQVGTDPELAPRQPITSVPLAIRSEVAEQLTVPVTTSTITDDANRLVPSGAIILWDGAGCPVGYTRLATYDGRFLVASGTAGNTGGSDTHTHGGSTGSHALTVNEMPPHTHGIRGHANGGGQGPNWFPNLSDPVYTTTESAGAGAGHSHTISAADSRPAFKTILLCKKD